MDNLIETEKKTDNLIELVKNRQGQLSLSTEKYANLVGLTTSTLWRFYNKKGNFNITFIRKLACFYAAADDIEMIGALAKFSLLLSTTNLSNLKQIGSLILDVNESTN